MPIQMTPSRSKSAIIRCMCAAAVPLVMTAPPASAQEGGGSTSSASTHSHAPNDVQWLPIFYDPALAANGFPNPFVKARIAGHDAIFIVDTGATRNVLADWYTKAANLSTSAMKDSKVNGSVVPRMVHHVHGRWSGGQRFTLTGTMVVPFPPYFESHHIGGLISPHFLAPAGTAAVLDLKVPSLRFEPFERARSALQKANASEVLPPAAPACHSELADPMYLVPVSAAGVTDLMMLDTGATKTILSEDSNIARAVGTSSEPGPRTQGLAGDIGAQHMVRDVQLLRGGRVVALIPSVAKPSWPCKAQGLLGMDALRSCVMILGDTEVALTCEGAREPDSAVTGR